MLTKPRKTRAFQHGSLVPKQGFQLQSAFGLRREEAIKFSPNYAIKDDHIKLKASRTKGGRARTVPIRNDEQRQLLRAPLAGGPASKIRYAFVLN